MIRVENFLLKRIHVYIIYIQYIGKACCTDDTGGGAVYEHPTDAALEAHDVPPGFMDGSLFRVRRPGWGNSCVSRS